MHIVDTLIRSETGVNISFQADTHNGNQTLKLSEYDTIGAWYKFIRCPAQGASPSSDTQRHQ